MNERQMQFRVGVVVFATMIIGGLLATLNSPLPTGWLPWGRGTYEIGIELPEAPGVGPDTPVRKNGLLIGRVASIEDRDDRVVRPRQHRRRSPAVPAIRLPGSHVGAGRRDDRFRQLGRLPPGAQPLADGATVQGRGRRQSARHARQHSGRPARATDQVARRGRRRSRQSGQPRRRGVRRRDGGRPRQTAAGHDRKCDEAVRQDDDLRQ